jgi:Protein of unknown function (DUF2844)
LRTRILTACRGRCATRHVPAFAFAVLMLAIPAHVFAVLGGSEASVQTDQTHMQASLRTTQSGAYAVHELHSPNGVVVREYASGGTVFGLAWEGPWLPDMHQLLGSYFESYQKALQAQSGGRSGRRPIHVELPGLVVNVAGHPRSFHGHAYVPTMMPQGVRAEEIR